MRETCNLPTASLRAPNRHLSFHSQSPRAPRGDVRMRCFSGTGFPIAARAKRRYQTRGQQNSTECDRVRRTTTKTRARPRARQPAFRFLPLGMDCTLSSFLRRRESSLGMDCALSSFPRRRESSLGVDCALSSFPRRRESSLGVDCALSSFPRRRESSLGIWIAPWAQRILGVTVPYPSMPINQTEPSYILCC